MRTSTRIAVATAAAAAMPLGTAGAAAAAPTAAKASYSDSVYCSSSSTSKINVTQHDTSWLYWNNHCGGTRYVQTSWKSDPGNMWHKGKCLQAGAGKGAAKAGSGVDNIKRVSSC